MRIVFAALAIAAAITLALLALAAFNLHVFVEAHRDELVSRGERALGRTVQIGAVAPSWWPIGIRFADVVIGEDPRFGTAPFVDAAAVRVAVRPGPLVLGRLEVSAIVLDRPRIAMVRDVAGRWNVASLGAGESEGSPASAKRHVRGRAIHLPLVWLGLAATDIRDGHIEVEDRSGPAARRLTATSVRLRSSELRLGGDARLRLDAAIFPGSIRPDAHLDLQIARLGLQNGAATPFTLHLELDDADLGTLAMIAGRRERWAGGVTQIVADATGVLDRFGVDLSAHADGEWRLGPHFVMPRVASRMSVRADATRDAVRLERASGAFGTLEWTAVGTVELRPWSVELTLQSVPESVASLGDVAPPWRLSDLAVTLRGDDALHVESARARLDDARIEGTARLAGLDPLVADGRLRAMGFGGSLDAIFDVDSATSARVRVEATGLDVGELAARCSSEPPTVTGRADLSAVVAVPWGASQPLRSLSGAGTARLVDGRVAAVNVVERVLRRMPAVRLLPRVVSPATRGRFADVFEAPGTGLRTATVPFTVADGVVTSPRLLLRADSYAMEGEATLDVARELRMRGDLILSPELSTALRGEIPALRYLARADGQLVFPFRMRGPLDDPIPEPDLKRLRLHGIEALAAGGAEHPARRLDRRPPRAVPGEEGVPDAPADAPAVERLERMLRP
ncbi:MAG: AsmA family protein [Deltaproteobacteria bacterium]|nr:AsmA family protein [Deltaproteobacteria bacterium]